MKLTKQRIKEIIKEELEGMNEEPVEEPMEEGMMDVAQSLMDPDSMQGMLEAFKIFGQAVKKFVTDPYTGPLTLFTVGGTTLFLVGEDYLEKKRASSEEERGDR